MKRPRILACLCLAAAVAACQRVTPPAPGRSAFRFVERAAAPGVKRDLAIETGDRATQYVPAKRSGELPSPVYPERARTARAEFATVGVHIVIGIDGRIRDIAPSLAAISTPSPFAADFRAAVDAALAQWRFVPAEVLQLETVTDPNGDYRRVKSREAVEAEADVAFTFTAGGKVESGSVTR